MNAYLAFIGGVACAGLGGELFIRGSVGLARWLRVSLGVIGVTVAAFATSGPELSVAVLSAISKSPQIALGNTLGGNVLNVGLVLGIALLLHRLEIPKKSLKQTLAPAFMAPILVGLLGMDGTVSRLDGLILLIVFLIWSSVVTIDAVKQRAEAEAQPAQGRLSLVLINVTLGLALLIAAGRLVVVGATGIAVALGLSRFTIGTVIVAIGTSAPEFATTMISQLRGHGEIGLNTILGSNIFNAMFIIGVAAIIYPIKVMPRELMSAVIFGVLAVAMLLPYRTGVIEKPRGILLLALYIAYVFWMIVIEK